MKKAWIVVVMFVFALILIPTGFTGESFLMDAAYENGYVKVMLDRVSRDESKDFMKQLVIYKDEKIKTTESLINQNHLNEIEKRIPYAADEGDVITVELYYGDDSVLTRVIKVTNEVVLDEEGDVYFNSVRHVQPVITTGLELKHPDGGRYGYDDTNKDVGQEGYGYEPAKDRYGYYKDDSPEMGVKYGYDDTNKDIGEKGYGYESKEIAPDSESYGRENIEVEFKR